MLTWKSDSGGSDIESYYGQHCEGTMYDTYITKQVIAVGLADNAPMWGFIFYHPDGTKTETATIAGRTVANDKRLDLCGTFIGFKCSFHNACARRELHEGRQLVSAFGTNGCNAYYDDASPPVFGFLTKVPNFSQYIGGPVIIKEWSYIPTATTCPSYTISTSVSYRKNGGALTSGTLGFMGYTPSLLKYTTVVRPYVIFLRNIF